MSRSLQILSLALALSVFVVEAPRGQSAPTTRATGVTIAGSVVDASLTPLAGVKVTLERGSQDVATTTTGDGGTFRFTGIAPGAYRVRAERGGFPTVVRDLRVPADVTVMQLPLVLSRPEDMAKADVQGRTLLTPSTATVTGTAPTVDVQSAQSVAAGRGVGPGGAGVGRAGGRGGNATVNGAAPVAAPEPQTRSNETWGNDRRDFDERSTPWSGFRYRHTGERYAHVPPNQFEWADAHPLSTFGADVDTASYTNVRRFLSSGQLPPRDAVRVEEFVNYLHFDYDQPRGNRPIALTTEVGDCPWAPSHKLVLIGARARTLPAREIEGRNIVLLIDVSGSMATAERLPLIKSALAMFVDTLRPDDRLAIVTYAGTSGVALPSTPARDTRNREAIKSAIANLSAGGSTNGASGLITAYRVASEAFIPGGVNRVILATDGDFNVGIVGQRDLFQLIDRQKESGVFLSVFGVGSGNLKDATMEMLADRGNGHYAYLDSLQEARRVLIREGDATLETVAKDVKFQVEFNPAMVAAWRLVGYENRVMAAQDFNDDRKDGGEVGAGQTVTVLYEIVPFRADELRGDAAPGRAAVDPLRYHDQPQAVPPPKIDPALAGEWLTVKARYKAPQGDASDMIVQSVRSGAGVRHLPLASAMAEFGLLLQSGSRDSQAWDALARRAGRLETATPLATEVDGFRELVAIAGGLSRLR